MNAWDVPLWEEAEEDQSEETEPMGCASLGSPNSSDGSVVSGTPVEVELGVRLLSDSRRQLIKGSYTNA